MFKRKKFTLKFKKAPIDCTGDKWREVNDSKLLYALYELQEHFNFEVIKVDFNDACSRSSITIKCAKDDYANIFSCYCAKLSDYIRDVSFQ